MRNLILSVMVVLALLVPMIGSAMTPEAACEKAASFRWYSQAANTACMIALAHDLAGPGPDGIW